MREVNYFHPLPVFLKTNIRISSSPLRVIIILHLKVDHCYYRKQERTVLHTATVTLCIAMNNNKFCSVELLFKD